MSYAEIAELPAYSFSTDYRNTEIKISNVYDTLRFRYRMWVAEEMCQITEGRQMFVSWTLVRPNVKVI